MRTGRVRHFGIVFVLIGFSLAFHPSFALADKDELAPTDDDKEIKQIPPSGGDKGGGIIPPAPKEKPNDPPKDTPMPWQHGKDDQSKKDNDRDAQNQINNERNNSPVDPRNPGDQFRDPIRQTKSMDEIREDMRRQDEATNAFFSNSIRPHTKTGATDTSTNPIQVRMPANAAEEQVTRFKVATSTDAKNGDKKIEIIQKTFPKSAPEEDGFRANQADAIRDAGKDPNKYIESPARRLERLQKQSLGVANLKLQNSDPGTPIDGKIGLATAVPYGANGITINNNNSIRGGDASAKAEAKNPEKDKDRKDLKIEVPPAKVIAVSSLPPSMANSPLGGVPYFPKRDAQQGSVSVVALSELPGDDDDSRRNPPGPGLFESDAADNVARGLASKRQAFAPVDYARSLIWVVLLGISGFIAYEYRRQITHYFSRFSKSGKGKATLAAASVAVPAVAHAKRSAPRVGHKLDNTVVVPQGVRLDPKRGK